MILLGFFLLFVIPAIFAAGFWALIGRLAHFLEGRDVMEQLRPDRADVADTDRAIDDIHHQVVVSGS